MVTAIILAGGTGSRMNSKGLPKQFLKIFGQPIIIYTLKTFQNCDSIDQIVIPCNSSYVELMKELVSEYGITKVSAVISGGKDRQGSIEEGLKVIDSNSSKDDIVVIHDGVRPLISTDVIVQNVETARNYGNAMTVKPNIETTVFTKTDYAEYEDFKDRNYTYTLTAPQTFQLGVLKDIYKKYKENDNLSSIPDASILLTYFGEKARLVIDPKLNLKITTPEDFYYLKAYLEMKENQDIFGINH